MKSINGKKSILAGLVLGGISLALASSQVQANSITGSIGFASSKGSFTLPAGQNLGDATELIGISADVNAVSGDYAGIPIGTSVAFANPLLVSSTPAAVLWTVVSGGNTYTFGATTSTVAVQVGSPATGYFLDMGGQGYAEINGVDQTSGTWLVTASQSGLAVSFESTGTVVGVPDSGMTLGLLGSAMLGLQGLRRKLGC
jgi:VPDSG-CTERM motif